MFAINGLSSIWKTLLPKNQKDLSPRFAAAILPALGMHSDQYTGTSEGRGESDTLHQAALQLLRRVVRVDATVSGIPGAMLSSDLTVILPRPYGGRAFDDIWPSVLQCESTPDRLLRFSLQLRQGEDEIVLAALQQLEEYLRENTDGALELVVGSSIEAHGLLHRVVPVLVASLFDVVSRFTNGRTLAAAGQCLGAIGAVSPGSMSSDGGFATEFKLSTTDKAQEVMDSAEGASASSSDADESVAAAAAVPSKPSAGTQQSVSPEVVRDVFGGKSSSMSEIVASMWKRGEFSPVFAFELEQARESLRTAMESKHAQLPT